MVTLLQPICKLMWTETTQELFPFILHLHNISRPHLLLPCTPKEPELEKQQQENKAKQKGEFSFAYTQFLAATSL